jgi:hypothetical protein
MNTNVSKPLLAVRLAPLALLAAVPVVGALLTTGCGSKTQQPPQYVNAGGPSASATGPTAFCPPGATCEAAAPTATATATAPATGSAAPAAAAYPTAAADLAAAKKNVGAGMTEAGGPYTYSLVAGGKNEFALTLNGTKCYSIVGVSAAGGVTDLDLVLSTTSPWRIGPWVKPTFPVILEAGRDGMTGGTAVIGKTTTPICPIVAADVPYKVEVIAKKGAGAVAVQVFAKNR